VEGAVPGEPARAAARDWFSARRILPLVAGVAGALSERTAGSTTVDDEVLGRWVTRPLEAVRRTRPDAHGTDALEDRLRGELLGRTCETSWTHGDLWLGNVLLDDGGHRVRGLVDWDAASEQGLHLVDLLHLLLTTRTAFERTHLGEAVREVLDGRPWAAHERRVLWEGRTGEGRTCAVGSIPEKVAVILMWLIHVEGVLGKNPRSLSDRLWFERNIEPVLQSF
jgi:aminoglycoside phosphotransferase (APT) family kinase protein